MRRRSAKLCTIEKRVRKAGAIRTVSVARFSTDLNQAAVRLKNVSGGGAMWDVGAARFFQPTESGGRHRGGPSASAGKSYEKTSVIHACVPY